MRHVKLPLYLLAFSIFALPAAAQSLVPDVEPYVNQYITEATGDYSPQWWNALSSELVLALTSSTVQDEQVALQNIIFFAEMHGKRLNLKPAVPHLLSLYRDGATEGTRIMALAALSAIGSHTAMSELREEVAYEASPRVKKLTVAALAEYYR
ncbi:MAG: hypothetical protein R2834_15010 [Rhodothermales bacterium]